MKILVTGSGSGLGMALVAELMRAGIDAFDFDRKFNILEDVANPDKDWLESISAHEIDGLINCAGINGNDWFEDVTKAGFDEIMATNAWGIVAMTQALLPKLKASKGFVINIVSNAAHIPMTSSLAYNASKAAALMITKQMAHELTPKYGITVFSVSPNKLVGTEMSRDIEKSVQRVRGWTAEYAQEYQRKALMHGLETPPERVAEFITNIIKSGQWKFLSGCDIPFGK